MQIEFKKNDEENLTPIVVANALIEHTTQYKPSGMFGEMFGGLLKEEEIETFNVAELREIAEHLLVYCEYHKEGEEEA